MSAGASVLVVEARYYPALSDELAAGAIDALDRAGAAVERIVVPGAFEIPAAVALAAGVTSAAARAPARRYDGYVALGCVIRGETSHYEHICTETARGLQELAFRHGLAIGFGVLTVENELQAWARARRSGQDKGGEAARACLAMIALKAQLGLTGADADAP